MASALYKGGLTADELRAVRAAWASLLSNCGGSSPASPSAGFFNEYEYVML